MYPEGETPSFCSDLWTWDQQGLLQAFFRFSGPASITDAEGRTLLLNESAEKLQRPCLGESSDSCSKQNSVCTMMGKKQCYILHSLSKKEALKDVSVCIQNSQGDSIAMRASTTLVKDSDGSVKGCLATLRYDSAATATEQDIGAWISRDIFVSDSLIENFPTPFFTVDQNLVVTRMNKPLEILSGYTREEVVGKMKCAQLLSTEQCGTGECLLKKSMEKHKAIAGIKKMVKNRRGETIPVLVNASIITSPSGQVLGGFETFQDISDQMELEKTRFRLVQTEKAGAVGRFAAGLAHEMNNPITGILNYCDLVSGALGDSHPLRQDMEQIVEQALRCKNIIANLSILSQKSLITKGLVDVNDNIRLCIQNCAHYILSGQVSMSMDLQENPPPPPIRGNRNLLSQVIHNLVVNAIDSLEGSGSVKVSSRFDPRLQEVVIRVEDTGCGIPEEDKSRIFDSFYTTKPPGQGTGLGLAIVHEIVQRHSGRIEIEDAPAGGTIFTVNLPLESPLEEC